MGTVKIIFLNQKLKIKYLKIKIFALVCPCQLLSYTINYKINIIN